jgi:hypothetical protein
MLKKVILILLVIWVFIFAFSGCSPAGSGNTQEWQESNPPGNGQLDYTSAEEQQMLDDTFRIDIKTIDAAFDYFPEVDNYHADCHAVVVFSMRPGQSRALVHLDPAINNHAVNGIWLNGEVLDFSDESDVRITGFETTSQKALEFQRDLEENRDHTLEISYGLNVQANYPGFYSNVSDFAGRGNEEVFPTLNTPHELARHYLTFRVHSDTVYRCIGSGLVEPVQPSEVQQWTLDTEREVASYTIMFYLAPAEDTVFAERNIAGVDVRVMTFLNGATIDPAFTILEDWLPELRDNLGPFPMPRGLSIFLTGSGGGMEYYGATITSLRALEHEVFHMYYACSTVNKTYRDSWLDEAITMWYEDSKNPNFNTISDNYRSDIVSKRTPVDVGFDGRAYNQGSNIMQAVAEELGGRDQMVDFLRYVHQNYSFSPFTTMEFLDYLQDYAGLDMRQRFLNWLYYNVTAASTAASSTSVSMYKQEVDMTPPESLRKKYRQNN